MEYYSAMKKDKNLTIGDDMGGPRGYDTEREKSERERQIPHDLTYRWNLKNKINKQKRNRLIDTENKLMGDEKREGIKKDKLAAAKQSRGRKAQHREQSR